LVDVAVGLIFTGSDRNLLNRSLVSLIANPAPLSAYLKPYFAH
jgi:hypothetical protein